MDAVVDAATLRLRPILMTTGAMVLGALPLALAHGAGAESRTQIGWVIVGGMTFGTLLTLFVVPTAYTLLARAAVHPSRSTPGRGAASGAPAPATPTDAEWVGAPSAAPVRTAGLRDRNARRSNAASFARDSDCIESHPEGGTIAARPFPRRSHGLSHQAYCIDRRRVRAWPVRQPRRRRSSKSSGGMR